ncbi:MAG: endonuclease/exonuclease/phosphatase family protein [Pseudomonadota bacterium]
MMKRLPVTLLACLLLTGCGSSTLGNGATDSTREQSTVTIMTFNVENLFDTQDDVGKDDHAYLPRDQKDDPAHIAKCAPIEVDRWRRECLELNWDEAALEFKLTQLSKVILQVNEGRGPDVIALQEVENKAILSRLSEEFLADAGYRHTVLIEGDDLRGIDVAFLSRLPLIGEATLHDFVPRGFPDRADDTRGILEATFELPDGTPLTGFAVHFPAPYHPIKMRELAYERLNQLRSAIRANHVVFAAGDFNTPMREMTQTTIMDDFVRPFWTVAHEVDCAGCRGTNYWYRGKTWSFLDMILFAPISEQSGWQMTPGGVFIANAYADQLNTDGTVKRFNLKLREGVSDHLPLVMTLERADNR